MIRHEDDRRIIFDYAQGLFKSAKAVIIKEEISIGDHFHKKKDEHFLLLTGKFKLLQLGEKKQYDIEAPHNVVIPRGLYHKFICEKGSILLCAATEEFDPSDEIK